MSHTVSYRLTCLMLSYDLCLVEALPIRDDPPSSDIIEPVVQKHELDGMAPPTHQSTKIDRETRDDNMANVVTELEGKLKKNQDRGF